MKDFKIPLSVPRDQISNYRKNYSSLTNGRGRLFLVAGDQKVEHLNDDFFGPGISLEDANPEHLFQVADASRGAVLAAPLGLISRYGQDYPSLPYLVKINGKTNLGREDKNSAKIWWKVEDLIKFKKQSKLNIVGIGYTLYLGGPFEAKMLAAAARTIFEAHQNGLTAVLWVYPRGQGIKEEDIHIISGGAGVAACLDADFVKIKYPYGAKDQKTTALRFREAVSAAGRTKIICVGGSKQNDKDILSSLERQLKISGTSGLAIGRNMHQRSLADATRLAKAISAVMFQDKSAAEALKEATEKDKKKKSSGRFLGIF